MPPPLFLLFGVIGGYLLADSVSQLVVAVVPWQPDSVAWRTAALRTLFTQITPLALAALLLGIALIRSEAAARRAGTAAGLLALVLLGLGGLLLTEGPVAGSIAGPDPDRRFARGQLQALVSAAAGGLGLVAAGVRLWTAGRGKALNSPAPAAGAE